MFFSTLPFGVYSLHPAFNNKTEKAENKDDKLHSVSQRFAYQEPDYNNEDLQKSKKQGSKAKPQARRKMTVRLRPRKVVCSNCKGICNENSENVDVSKKRKLDSDDDTPRDGSESSKLEKKYLMGSMLIPKLSRIDSSEVSDVKTKNISKLNDKLKNVKSMKPCDDSEKVTRELAFVSVSDNSELCEKEEDSENSFSNLFSNARTLKISFGEGEGTVVKIPPLGGDFNEDSGVSCDMSKPTKAVKKAMKKAKKQAKKNTDTDKAVDMWIDQSPKHIGALSPRNNVPNSTTVDPLEKKHKHKAKHKKKDKIQKKRDENTSKCESIDYFSNIKSHCLKQKLSISLRRLSSNSYERRNEEGSDDGDNESVPDFPPSSEGVGGKLLRVSPGDIVWGKVVGFPWWPGRVLSVTPTSRAHVAWYASTTSSLMPCDSLSPFLEDYKVCYMILNFFVSKFTLKKTLQ